MGRKALCAAPPMGWNSWNTFAEHINEDLVKEIVDSMKEQGFLEAGYEYVVMDDCWSLRERDLEGKLVADPEKFPNGIKALADYIHEKGFKFGMYSCCGTRTCANYQGSFEHEFEDAQQFAQWGVDYLSMKRKPKNQLCALAALSVSRHAACSMCASCTCTALFMRVCVGEDMEVQV